jgi:DNA-binding NarL/FixJ family response regulator
MANLPVPAVALAGGHRSRLGVIVVDPLPVVRAGLAALIERRLDLSILAEAGSSEETLAALEGASPGSVVIVGLGLDGPHDGYWLIEAIHDRFPELSVVACGARSDPMSISRALFCGAAGFVDKNAEAGEFLESIKLAVQGETVLTGPPSEWVGAIARGLERGRAFDGRLTDRERQVLNVAAQGLTAREIADRLGVRERTVTTHLSRIYGKLGVRTRIAAIRVATVSGLVSAGMIE